MNQIKACCLRVKLALQVVSEEHDHIYNEDHRIIQLHLKIML
jgi:hypothetical protein